MSRTITMVAVGMVAVLGCSSPKEKAQPDDEPAARRAAPAPEQQRQGGAAVDAQQQQQQPVQQQPVEHQPAGHASPIPQPQDLVNEEWVLKKGEVHSLSFTLTEESNVTIEVSGVKDTDKGFSLRVVDEKYRDACTADPSACPGEAGWSGLAVRSFDHTARLRAGRWTFFVKNTENLLKSMIVKAHVIVNAP